MLYIQNHVAHYKNMSLVFCHCERLSDRANG